MSAFADTTINEKSVPQSGQTNVTLDIAPAYIVTIPADTTVTLNDTLTDNGANVETVLIAK
ncbi:hypothetical protein [Ruminococcus albus]|nr:hypothetical protein [Ruminococcus albus]